MLLGAQYYRAPFPEDKYWEDDIAKMRDSGLNTIQMWVIWAWVESRPGEFNYEEYDRLVDLAEKAGLNIVLSTIAEIHPYWIHREVPGSEMIDNMGHKVISSNRIEVHFGLTPGGCTDHPGVWERMSEFLRQTVMRYKSCSTLAGWDAWNELRWNINADGLVCYCEHTLRAFRDWLDKKYGGLDGLNQAWKRRYGQWGEVLPGKAATERPYTEMMAFDHFITWRANRHGKRRYDLMKAIDPDHPITLHEAGPCTLMSGGKNETPMDRGNDWFYADDTDGVGTSSFPNWEGMGEDVYVSRIEHVASAAGMKQLWLSELQGGQPARGFEVMQPVPVGEQQRWIYNGIARGADAVLFWCWRDEVFTSESSGFGLAGSDGMAEQRLAAMKITGQWIKDHEDLLTAYKPTAPRVGVWFSPQTYYLHWAQEMGAGRSVNALQGICLALIRASVPHLVVEEEHLDVLKKLDVLFLPRTLVMDDDQADVISAWVEAGGTLVCESECGAFSSAGFYRYPEDRFLARWGIREVGRRKPSDTTISFEMNGQSYTLPFTQWWTPMTVNEDPQSMFVDVPAGKGRVIAVGTYLAESYFAQHTQAFDRWICRIVAPANTQPGAAEVLQPMDMTPENLVYLRTGQSNGKKLAFVFSNGDTKTTTLRFTPGFFTDKEVHDSLTGQTYPLKNTGKGSKCTISLGQWGVTVLVD